MTNDEEDIVDDFEYVETETGKYPVDLNDEELEIIYLGLIFNNPKAISKYYFEYDCCHFSNNVLLNLYKIIIFRDADAYTTSKIREGFKLPKESGRMFEMKMKAQKIALQDNYSLELVYKELRKLFILKKHFIAAPTLSMQTEIIKILDYQRFDDMDCEEIENTIEQIGVTNRLSQSILNSGLTEYILTEKDSLRKGLKINFPILNKVFKGFRKGEFFAYSLPSNSGKSRLTVKLAAFNAIANNVKTLIISNEMSEEKIRLCLMTTIINDPEIRKIHEIDVKISETEILEFKFRPSKGVKTQVDENGYIVQKEDETEKEFLERLKEESNDFNLMLRISDWVDSQVTSSLYFINITEHSDDDIKKIILNYYYRYGVEYVFYDTLKTDTEHIGEPAALKKTATMLANIAQENKIFVATSVQLLESDTLPVNLTINDLSENRTVKEVLDILMLIKQINRDCLDEYEYSDTVTFEECKDIEFFKDPDVRYYACVVDKNRAGEKPTVLFKINLAYNSWEELGYLRLKQKGNRK